MFLPIGQVVIPWPILYHLQISNVIFHEADK